MRGLRRGSRVTVSTLTIENQARAELSRVFNEADGKLLRELQRTQAALVMMDADSGVAEQKGALAILGIDPNTDLRWVTADPAVVETVRDAQEAMRTIRVPQPVRETEPPALALVVNG